MSSDDVNIKFPITELVKFLEHSRELIEPVAEFGRSTSVSYSIVWNVAQPHVATDKVADTSLTYQDLWDVAKAVEVINDAIAFFQSLDKAVLTNE